MVNHLPSIAVFGAPCISPYERSEDRSYAPTTANWAGTTGRHRCARCSGTTTRRGSNLVVTGNETTRRAITLWVQALLGHPDQVAVLTDADDAGRRTAVEELQPVLPRLELDGPAPRIRSSFTDGLKRVPVRIG